MKKFEITYTDQNGSTRQTNIIERDEAAAKKSFKANNKGVQIETIQITAENVSASKAQEREALEEIRKIVEAMGPDSYIATAFQGCFEIADENIEYDFGDSMKGRLEMAEKKLHDQIGEYQECRESLRAATSEIETLKRKLEDSTRSCQEREQARAHTSQEMVQMTLDLRAAVDRADKAETEITRLKAKLYDYMTAGEQ